MESMRSMVQLSLPRNQVGQILDGLDVLIEQWEATAAYFRTGEPGNAIIRKCSDADEAEWIAGFYGEVAAELRRQLAIHDSVTG